MLQAVDIQVMYNVENRLIKPRLLVSVVRNLLGFWTFGIILSSIIYCLPNVYFLLGHHLGYVNGLLGIFDQNCSKTMTSSLVHRMLPKKKTKFSSEFSEEIKP